MQTSANLMKAASFIEVNVTTVYVGPLRACPSLFQVLKLKIDEVPLLVMVHKIEKHTTQN